MTTLQEKLRVAMLDGLSLPICSHAASHIDNLEAENAKLKAEVSALNRGLMNKITPRGAVMVDYFDVKQILDDPKASSHELRGVIDDLLVEIGVLNNTVRTRSLQLAGDRAMRLKELRGISQLVGDIRELREEVNGLKDAIEAMRTAGGSGEFQIAFDRAKELASAL